MDKATAVRFWLGHLATPHGREAVKVMLDNAPLCCYYLDQPMDLRFTPLRICGKVASLHTLNNWYCEEHAPTT